MKNYGSNEKEDLVWEQDGVAPQFCIPGLDNTYRAFIPNDGTVPRGFMESHFIENYWWIFSKLQEGKPGYVKARE